MLRSIVIISILFSCTFAYAQDPQYSQYYANALYLNPAFAGSNQTSRAIVHARLQWPALGATFISSTFSFDHYFEKYKSGIGILFNTDRANTSANRFKNTEVGLQYAYQLDLSENWVLRPALQLSFAQKTFNPNDLIFGDVLNNEGIDPTRVTQEPTVARTNYMYPDISTGGLLYSSNMWVGIAASHLNQPTQSFTSTGTDKLQIKTTLHAGMKIKIGGDIRRYGWQTDDEETSISPVMLYKMQGKSDQLDLGAYFRKNIIIFGAFYRGIPMKVYKPERINNEAIIVLIGFTHQGFNFGYSYDYTISTLRRAQTGGAHEISLTYNFLLTTTRNKKQKPPIKNRKPVCPKF